MRWSHFIRKAKRWLLTISLKRPVGNHMIVCGLWNKKSLQYSDHSVVWLINENLIIILALIINFYQKMHKYTKGHVLTRNTVRTITRFLCTFLLVVSGPQCTRFLLHWSNAKVKMYYICRARYEYCSEFTKNPSVSNVTFACTFGQLKE